MAKRLIDVEVECQRNRAELVNACKALKIALDKARPQYSLLTDDQIRRVLQHLASQMVDPETPGVGSAGSAANPRGRLHILMLTAAPAESDYSQFASVEGYLVESDDDDLREALAQFPIYTAVLFSPLLTESQRALVRQTAKAQGIVCDELRSTDLFSVKGSLAGLGLL
jgi:hypothetical protein